MFGKGVMPEATAGPILKFEGEHDFLSNFNESFVIPYEGGWYASAEVLYQSQKADSEEDRDYVLAAQGPGDSKFRGRRIKLRDDWEVVKIPVMILVIRAKFSVPEFRELLLATGERELIEGNHWGDYFWGICKGKGENWLGKILMERRELIRMELRR